MMKVMIAFLGTIALIFIFSVFVQRLLIWSLPYHERWWSFPAFISLFFSSIALLGFVILSWINWLFVS